MKRVRENVLRDSRRSDVDKCEIETIFEYRIRDRFVKFSWSVSGARALYGEAADGHVSTSKIPQIRLSIIVSVSRVCARRTCASFGATLTPLMHFGIEEPVAKAADGRTSGIEMIPRVSPCKIHLSDKLTDHGQIDFGVSRLADLEVDAAPVDARVLLPDVIDPQLRRLLVRHEIGPIREHGVVRPSLGDTEVPVPGVDTAPEKRTKR